MNEDIKPNTVETEVEGEKKTRKKTPSTQFKVTILAEDERLQEIFDRVEGVGQRAEFIKEAIYYWDYILHRCPAVTSRYVTLKKDFVLSEDEKLYINLANKVIPLPKKGRKNISVRVTINKDDHILNEILSRVNIKQEFIREAVDYWDYTLHNSSLMSRYVRLEPGVEKRYYNYGTMRDNMGDIINKNNINPNQHNSVDTPLNNVNNNTEEKAKTNASDIQDGPIEHTPAINNNISTDIKQTDDSDTTSNSTEEVKKPRGPVRRRNALLMQS